jgi:hypothetical protein
LRRFINELRLSWATQTLESRETRHEVAKETAKGAQLIRGFDTPIEDRTKAPTNPIQLTTAVHRRGQTKKCARLAWKNTGYRKSIKLVRIQLKTLPQKQLAALGLNPYMAAIHPQTLKFGQRDTPKLPRTIRQEFLILKG